jgi:hypothetical protein
MLKEWRREHLPLWLRQGYYTALHALRVAVRVVRYIRSYIDVEWIIDISPAWVARPLAREAERVRLWKAHSRFWRGRQAEALLPLRLLRLKTDVVWCIRRASFYALKAPALLAKYEFNNLAGLLRNDRRPALVFVSDVSARSSERFMALLEAEIRRGMAFVTRDRATSQRIAALFPGAPVFAMQDYWIDTEADLRIHVAAHELVAELDRRPVGEARPLLDLLEQSLFGQTVQRSRLGEAVAAAVRTGADLVVIVERQDFPGIQFCRDLACAMAGTPFQAYELVDLHRFLLGAPVGYANGSAQLVAEARKVLQRWSSLRAFADGGRRPERGSRSATRRAGTTIAVCSEAHRNMPYWAGVIGSLRGAAHRERRAILFTRSGDVAWRARQAGFQANIVASSGPLVPPGFLRAYTALVDMVEAELTALERSPFAPIERLVRRDVLARLLERRVMYWAINELRSVESMAREFQRHDVGVVISMPHWSTIGAVAGAAAGKIGALHSSLPVVSVNGTPASLVGWEKLDLIGCYGEQCVEAFRQVGIPDARLRLLGNIALDQPLRLSRDEALARNPDLRRCLDGASHVILVATSAIDPDEILWFRELGRAAGNVAGSRILLRPHPSFGAQAYREFVPTGGGPERCAVFDKAPIHDLIRLSDLVITDYSTVGAEAVLMGKRLLVVNCTGKRFPLNNYDEHGVALLATSPDQVGERIRQLLFDRDVQRRLDEQRSAFAKRYNWMNDGHAAERYIDALFECRTQQSDVRREETVCPSALVSALSPARAPSSVS